MTENESVLLIRAQNCVSKEPAHCGYNNGFELFSSQHSILYRIDVSKYTSQQNSSLEWEEPSASGFLVRQLCLDCVGRYVATAFTGDLQTSSARGEAPLGSGRTSRA